MFGVLFFFYLLYFFFFCLYLFFFIIYIRRYPGYAVYRNLYPFSCARLLFWMETGIDICYPRDRQADLYLEKLFLPAQELLEIRRLHWILEDYFRDLC
jgi:hypothetical protein